jgi:hypothetical protein
MLNLCKQLGDSMKLINKKIASLSILLVISGCGSTISKQDSKIMLNGYQTGTYDSAVLLAEKNLGFYDEKTGKFLNVIPTKIENSLLHMDAAELHRMQGNYTRAIQHYNVVDEKLFQDQDREFISTAYEPTPHEKILTNFYKSITFWANGDVDNARVEFNRANERTRLAVMRYEAMINKEREKAKDKASAISTLNNNPQINQLTNEWDVFDSFVNPTVTLIHSLYLASQNGVEDSTAKTLMDRVKDMLGDSALPEHIYDYSDVKNNKVWIVTETGLGPRLDEKRLDVPIVWKEQPLILQMAFPEVKLMDNSVVLSNLTINNEVIDFYQLNTMEKLVKTELKKRMPAIVASQGIQAIIKAAIQYRAQKEGKAAGFAALLLTSAATSADTTIWKMTPEVWNISKIDNNVSNTLQLRYGNAIESIELPTGSAIVYIKQPTAQSKPLIEILKL